MKDWWRSVKSIKSHYREKSEKATREQHQVFAKCASCDAIFKTARAHAVCCSAACRMRQSRKNRVAL